MPSRLNPGQGAGSQLQNNMRSDIIIEPYDISANGILLLNANMFDYGYVWRVPDGKYKYLFW